MPYKAFSLLSGVASIPVFSWQHDVCCTCIPNLNHSTSPRCILLGHEAQFITKDLDIKDNVVYSVMMYSKCTMIQDFSCCDCFCFWDGWCMSTRPVKGNMTKYYIPLVLVILNPPIYASHVFLTMMVHPNMPKNVPEINSRWPWKK